ncbi:DUF1161 domain-containing protein [Dokdonella immobilis]|uniref:DUF1161 domain-containing protein n=1 Tax=Dokdonella immobilis TaxID=578942 RepID=A0A1I4VXU4_9GAMM|nr:DUF1161 domain-containing protein [Dokdonella immobilis]SFN05970.1 Protein of unknown function [Dokdonella immobilis]
MKFLLTLALIIPCLANAEGTSLRKPCDELKSEIAARIEHNGVRAYSLEVIAADTESDAKIVGSCNGGTQRIAYRRGESSASAPTRQVATALH